MAEDTTVTCVRCGRNAPAATGVTYGGTLGAEIREKVCNTCWQEWLGMEVMVINELRLDFMDPRSMETLTQQLRQFLLLDGPADPT